VAHIQTGDLKAWTDGNKIVITTIDADLESEVAIEVIAQCATAYNTSGWTDISNTPALVRKAIAMTYVGWLVERTYSEDSDSNAYAMMLLAAAGRLIASIQAGSTVLPDAATGTNLASSAPTFYPTDSSSLMTPIPGVDTSLGGPVFSMGDVW
jgi:hypothetical protein